MSTYSDNLKIEEIGTGEQAGTWGVTTNDNFVNVFEQAIVGRVTVSFSDADVTLTAINSVASQSFRNVYLNCTGTNTGAKNLIVPAINKNYVVQNNTTGGFNIVVKTSAGTGITVPNGRTCTVYTDGTNVIQAFDYLPTLNVPTLNITTLDATNIEVTNIKAKDGTASVTIADSTGIFTHSTATVFTAGTVSAPAITTTGDTNTGIYFPAADTIGFTGGGVESGRFTSTGALQLNANLTFSGTGNRITGDFSNATAANRVMFQTSTTDSGSILGVIPNGSSGNARIQFFNSSSPGSGTNSIADFGVIGTTDVRLQATYEGSGTQLPMTFYTGGSERLRIDTSGNVGIGVSSPVSRLDVNKTSSDTISRANSVAAFGDYFSLGAGLVLQQTLNSPFGFALQASNAANTLQFPLLLNPSGGNVGIGVSTPNNKLQSSLASVPVSVPASGAGGHALAVGSTGFGLAAGALTSGNSYIQSARWDGTATNYNLLLQPNGGSVGVGTTNPLSKLEAVGTQGRWRIDPDGSAGEIQMLTSNTANTLFLDLKIRTQQTIFETVGVERMRIDTSGNVSIGAPSAPVGGVKLTVASTGESVVLIQDLDQANTYGSFSHNAGATQMVSRNGSSFGSYVFFGYDGTTFAERLRIAPNGWVGIGTSATSAQLSVLNSTVIEAGSPTATTSLELGTGRTGNGFAFIDLVGDTTYTDYAVRIIRDQTGPNASTSFQHRGTGIFSLITLEAAPMTFSTTSLERMRLTSDGELLVGKNISDVATSGFRVLANGPTYSTITSFAGSTYHVYSATSGSFRFYVLENGGVANFSGNDVNLSDERTKKNIEVSGGYLDKICSIPVKLFNYKDDAEGEQKTLGVIAQDVEAIAPEFVNNDGWKGEEQKYGSPLKTIYSTDMMFGMMKAIQELKAELDSVKAELQTLKGN
jgi:hypothetical protein